jgi:hypothetical protein
MWKGNVLATEGGMWMAREDDSANQALPLGRGRVRKGALAIAIVLLLSWCIVYGKSGGGVAASGMVQSSPVIPGGTVLPIALEKRMGLREPQAGQPMSARIMQEVPLPSGEKIPFRSLMKGLIVSVAKEEEGPGVKFTMKFNQVETKKETLTVVTYLRAIASYEAVRAAQIPRAGADGGTPEGWANTSQIGGDIRFGDGGEVRDRSKQKVGMGVRGGVLVYVRANPSRGCDGPVGDDRPQALWVFSADACGVYDLKDASITRKGRGEPVGEFTLRFEKEDMKLEAGTAMLLRVIAPQP